MPDLDGTLTKYLRCLEPIQSPDDFQQTKHLVDRFRSSNETIGQCLQEMLIEHANKSENYVCQPRQTIDHDNLFFVFLDGGLVVRRHVSCKSSCITY